MARLRLELDGATFDRLIADAAGSRRPVPLQAEWLLMQSLGTVPKGGVHDLRPGVTTLAPRRRPEVVGGE